MKNYSEKTVSGFFKTLLKVLDRHCTLEQIKAIKADFELIVEANEKTSDFIEESKRRN